MPQKPPGRPGCRKSLWQGRHEGFGGRLVPNVAFWSHYRKALGKRPKCRKSLREGQDAAKAFSKGATRDLEAGECVTLLSEATIEKLLESAQCRKSLREGQDAAKAFGKGATRDLEAG